MATLLLVGLDQSTQRAKHARLKDAIMATITSGELGVGDQLPPEAELAATLSLSLGTVRRCLAGLVQEGVVKREHGRGTFIADQQEALSELWEFRVLMGDGIVLPIRTRQALDVALDGIWVQQAGHVIHANQAMADLLRATEPRSLVGRAALDCVVSADHQRVETWFNQIDAEGGGGGRVGFRVIGFDGDLVDVEAVALETMWRRQPALLVVVRDVTTEKQAELALQEKEGVFRNLIEMMAEGALVHQDDRIVFMNTAGLAQFGADDNSALMGRPIFDVIQPDDRAVIRDTFQQLYAAGGSAAPIRFHGLRVDGRALDLEASACRMTWERRAAILMTLREPVALRRAERALEESEDRCRRILEALPAAVSIHQDDLIIYANQNLAGQFGVDGSNDLIGRCFYDFLSPEDGAIARERHRQILASGRPVPLRHWQIERQDGGMVNIEAIAAPISWDGKPAILGVGIDVSERKQLQQALRESEIRLERVIDALPILISYVDAQQCYRLSNQAYERWFGHARDTVYGRHVRELLGAEAYRAIQGFIERALRGDTVTFESAVPYRDGGTRRVHATYVPDPSEDGMIKGFFAVIADITNTEDASSKPPAR